MNPYRIISNPPVNSITYLGYRITERCNQSCPFCFSREKDIAFDQPISEIKLCLENIQRARISTIGIMGGEPLVRHDLINILKLIKKFGFETILSTNALLLTDNLLHQLKHLVDYLSISLDADNQPLNDHYRGIGQFTAATRIITTYNPQIHPFKLKVNTIVHQQNFHNGIDQIPRFFLGKPIVWKLLQYTPRLDGFKVRDQFQITTKAFKLKSQQLQKKYPSTIIAQRTYSINEKYDLLLLRPNGDLQINHHDQYQVVGNAYQDEISHVIESVWHQQTSYYHENWDEFERSYRQLN